MFGEGDYSGGDFGSYYGAFRQTKDTGSTWEDHAFEDFGSINVSSFYTPTEGYFLLRGLVKVTAK